LLIRLAESEVLEVEAQECVFEQTVQREWSTVQVSGAWVVPWDENFQC
jgi:hypothetical protein